MNNDIDVTERKRLITAALPYINNVPHLGHIVGSHLPADIFARFCRIKGYDTLFVGGTDENGSTSEIAAEEVGVPIEEFSEKLYNEHKKIYDWFGISYDNFSRTSNPLHHETVQDFFKTVDLNGYIEKGKILVFYSKEDKKFLPDRYVIGECPECGYPEANGDQCEKCSAFINPVDLKNPRSKITNSKVELVEAEHLFFRLDEFSERLKKWIESRTDWRKQVKNLALGWIAEGLKKRCITRNLKHGVKVPLKDFEDKVFYVWFDAPIGYITSTKEASDDWEDFWKNSDSEIYNFLGKDNIPFHTLFWPAMIMAHGKYNLPKNVVGLQYLNYEGKKFSKSKQIGVFCEKLPELGLHVDMWRSYLIKMIPENGDTEFRWKDFQEHVNTDLIGNYANYVNRIIKFTDNNLNGVIEKPNLKEIPEREKYLLNDIQQKVKEIENLLEKTEIRRAYLEVLSLTDLGNKYLQEKEPWKTIKENPEETKITIYFGARVLKALAVVSFPFLPNTAGRIWKQLDLAGESGGLNSWEIALEDFKTDQRIGTPENLFEKITDEMLEEYKNKAAKGVLLEEFFKKNKN